MDVEQQHQQLPAILNVQSLIGPLDVLDNCAGLEAQLPRGRSNLDMSADDPKDLALPSREARLSTDELPRRVAEVAKLLGGHAALHGAIAQSTEKIRGLLCKLRFTMKNARVFGKKGKKCV
jgi:hypothetical protein